MRQLSREIWHLSSPRLFNRLRNPRKAAKDPKLRRGGCILFQCAAMVAQLFPTCPHLSHACTTVLYVPGDKATVVWIEDAPAVNAD